MKQKELIKSFIREAGFITHRIAIEKLKINSPFQYVQALKPELKLDHLWALTKSGRRVKIFYTSRKAAAGYVKFIGGMMI